MKNAFEEPIAERIKRGYAWDLYKYYQKNKDLLKDEKILHWYEVSKKLLIEHY